MGEIIKRRKGLAVIQSHIEKWLEETPSDSQKDKQRLRQAVDGISEALTYLDVAAGELAEIPSNFQVKAVKPSYQPGTHVWLTNPKLAEAWIGTVIAHARERLTIVNVKAQGRVKIVTVKSDSMGMLAAFRSNQLSLEAPKE